MPHPHSALSPHAIPDPDRPLISSQECDVGVIRFSALRPLTGTKIPGTATQPDHIYDKTSSSWIRTSKTPERSATLLIFPINPCSKDQDALRPLPVHHTSKSPYLAWRPLPPSAISSSSSASSPFNPRHRNIPPNSPSSVPPVLKSIRSPDGVALLLRTRSGTYQTIEGATNHSLPLQ